MSPQLALLVAMELQVQRLKAALVSAAPAQTFTAKPQAATGFHYVPRKPRKVRPQSDTLHGTQAMYVQCGCRCRPCCAGNTSARRERVRGEMRHCFLSHQDVSTR